jgi:hypothetical protein
MLYVKACVRSCILCITHQIFITAVMFQTKVVNKNETHILYSVLLFHKAYLFCYLQKSECDRIVMMRVHFLSC